MRIGVGLSIPELATRGGRFSPASLFTGGVQGAWYAPDDFSTLFQDSAGTTPVTAVEQPVGLMLDKSQGLVLGSELVTNGDFSGGTTGWTAGNFATLSVTGGKLSVVNGALALGQGRQTITTVAGKTYKLSVTFTSVSASRGYIFVGTFAGDNSRFSAGPLTTSQTVTGYFTAVGTSTYLSIGNADNSIGLEVQFDDVTVKDIAGNHARAPNDPSRPMLRARYNLLTYSEQFDNAAWVKMPSTTVVANQAVAPDGTNTAELLYPTTTGTFRGLYQTFTASAVSYTTSLYAKAAGLSTLGFSDLFGSVVAARFDLNAGTVGFTAAGYTASIQSVGNGWYRCSVTGTAAAALQYVFPYVCDSTSTNTATASGTSGIYIWGADLRTGTSAGTYQRIAAATDYATAGFLPYLALDGTDDSMATGSIDFTATDKMSICAGVTKLSDAALGMVAELSANLSSNAGTFWVLAPLTVGASGDFDISFKGTNQIQVTSGIKLSPVTAVITGTSNIAAPSAVFRYNGTQTELDTGSQGTGNFGNYPLYIGRRGGASLPFNGRIYQMVVCGKTLSAGELASTEAYVNQKTGAY